jgi:uncharacterized membrane protein YhiD involved in acid resistance
VIFGVPVYAGWIAALATGVGLWVGIGRGIAAAIELPVLAFVGLVAFEREASVLKMIRAFLASRQTPLRARASLKRQRAAIATVLDRVRDRLETTDPADTSRPPGPSRSNHGSG